MWTEVETLYSRQGSCSSKRETYLTTYLEIPGGILGGEGWGGRGHSSWKERFRRLLASVLPNETSSGLRLVTSWAEAEGWAERIPVLYCVAASPCPPGVGISAQCKSCHSNGHTHSCIGNDAGVISWHPDTRMVPFHALDCPLPSFWLNHKIHFPRLCSTRGQK